MDDVHGIGAWMGLQSTTVATSRLHGPSEQPPYAAAATKPDYQE